MAEPDRSQAPDQAASGRAGYLSPEEQARRQSQDAQADRGMNMGTVAMYKRRDAEDAAANAAASGGGYKMDVAAMRALLPKWESIADKLSKLEQQGRQFVTLPQPAEDEASGLQMKAAKAHADTYLESVRAQRQYAEGYVEALNKAIQATDRQNQAAANTMNKHRRDR
ncbi:hypothetical protein [Amycolatopsis sp. NPDC059657]|uniref:hypothetical protein n=1 Tax=Amycolatopsis sp. NPDC059657 TaxID=3346899 RepID=UPI003670AC9B